MGFRAKSVFNDVLLTLFQYNSDHCRSLAIRLRQSSNPGLDPVGHVTVGLQRPVVGFRILNILRLSHRLQGPATVHHLDLKDKQFNSGQRFFPKTT